MKKTKILLYIAIIIMSLMGMVVGTPAQASVTNPVADVAIFPDGIEWTPRVDYSSLILKVSYPDGSLFEKTFITGVYPFLDFSRNSDFQVMDGRYNYELQVVPKIDPNAMSALVQARTDGNTSLIETLKKDSGVLAKPLIQSGSFLVHNGLIVTGDGDESGGDTKNDVLHYDDVIITGSLCVGFDCANGESFGYCTEKFKENNLQVCFEDTSVGTFPTNDWKIQINDTTSGGASYFTLWDTDAGRRPFTIEAGAPAHSLYVEDYGRVGLGTSIPYVELHIVDGDSPTIRLDQDGSSGWAAQRWDMCGNETNFFIRDVTNGSKLCFRIQPNTPSNTLCMRSTGYVGIGTWSPEYPLEVETTGITSVFAIQRTDGSTAKVAAGLNGVQFGSETNHPVHFMTNSSDKRLTIATNGYVGISDETPDYPLDMGTLANGAYCTTGGVWHDASSREFKENISDLTGEEASLVVAQLNPVKYNYKVDKDEKHVGFIAEDVPDLVASKDRKAMSAMDVVAVLTRVVQEQQKMMSKQEKMFLQLSGRVQDLENQLKLKQNMNLARIESH